MVLELERCKRTDPEYQAIRDRHYIPNKGTHGQQIHYKIRYNGVVVGIISGASAVYAVKERDIFFGLTNENRRVALNSIVSNVVFRLEYHEKNLGTKILKMWRKQIAIDWEKQYGVQVHGFETFIIETDTRKGAMYKADNWTYLGETAGSTKVHSNGLNAPATRESVVKKLIFAIKVPNTSLCTSYTSTWRGKPKNDK